MGIGVITVSEASRASGVPLRTLHRWISDRAKVDPTLIVRLSKKKWHVSKAALAAMLGLDVTDIEASLDRHGKELDSLRREVKSLKSRVAALEAARPLHAVAHGSCRVPRSR